MNVAHALVSLAMLTLNPSPIPAHAVPAPQRVAVTIDGVSTGGFVDFRASTSPLNSTEQLPGRPKFQTVTLERGVVKGSQLYQWFHSKAAKTVVIVGQTSSGQKLIYHLKNAVPQHYKGPPLSATSNDVAIEELVLSAESISITYPSP